LFEVKEFDEPAVKPSGGFSACPAIQEKIRQAKKQFKPFKDCCTLVLWNSETIYRRAVGRQRFELWVGAAVLANNLMKIAALLTKRSSRKRRAA
jgi:hypothetical protein